MDFKHHIETTWNLLLGNIVALILITLVLLGVSALSLGILAPVIAAGYTHSLLLLIRNGREPRIQDLFSHMNLFLPLLGFALVVFVASFIGFLLLFLPGVVLIAAVIFCCVYMFPLMTDRKMDLIMAIKESYAMARQGDILDHVVVVVLYLAITMIGGSTFIGVLLTMPMATLFLMSTYEEKRKTTPPPAPQTQSDAM